MVPKFGIRALKQMVAAIYSLEMFQQNVAALHEQFETTLITRRYKGLKLTLNASLTRVEFSSELCRLSGAEFDKAVESLILSSLAAAEKKRDGFAKQSITDTLEQRDDSLE